MSKTALKSNRPSSGRHTPAAAKMENEHQLNKAGDAAGQALEAALQRIQASPGVYGGARPCALAWVLAFVQENVAQYSYGTFANRWWEALRFGRDAGLGPQEERVCNVVIEGAGPLRGPGGYIRSPAGELVFDDSAGRQGLAKLQEEARLLVQWYVGGATVGTGEMPISFRTQPTKPGLWAVVSDEHVAFRYQLIHLLADLGPRIRQCSLCKRFVLAGRTDKRYCSNVCQARAYKRDHAGASEKGKRKQRKQLTKGGTHGKTR